MTTHYNTEAELPRLVQSLIHREDPLDWLEWLPLAEVASRSPERWATAFSNLALDRQFDLLDRLCLPDAGPLADGLVGLLAAYSDANLDANIREMLLNAEAEAETRHGARLQTLRDRYELLNHAVAARRQRLSQEFDLAGEIVRLQGELARMRQEEFNQDDRFARIHNLEAELLRYETRRRILDRYDQPAREAYLSGLRREVEAQDARKREVEAAVSQATQRRDMVRREADAQRARLETLTTDLAALDRALEQARADITAAQAGQQRRVEEGQRLRQELAALNTEEQRLAENNRQLEELARAQRTKLEQLRAAAVQAGAQEVVARIAEVYALLPRDGADPGFARS